MKNCFDRLGKNDACIWTAEAALRAYYGQTNVGSKGNTRLWQRLIFHKRPAQMRQHTIPEGNGIDLVGKEQGSTCFPRYPVLVGV